MFKRNFAALVVTGLLATAGAAQANSVFPSAAPEGSEYALNSPVPATPAGLSGAVSSVFPSAAPEGSETSANQVRAYAPRNLERSLARGQTGVFPTSAME